MNQFFKGSAIVSVFYAAVSACLFIALSFLYSISSQSGAHLDYLSEGAYSVTIEQAADGDYFTNDDMKDFIAEHGNITVVKPMDFVDGIRLYASWNNLNSGELESGRAFTDSEMTEGGDVALVSGDMLSDCIGDDGAYHCVLDGGSYEVVGVLKDNSLECIAPLMTVLSRLPDYSASGTYYISVGESTAVIAEALVDTAERINSGIAVTVSPIDSGLVKNGILPDNRLIIAVCAAVLLLMALNLYSINSYWFSGKAREFFVYKLCGLSDVSIYIRLFFNYLALVLIGTMTGGILSAVFATVTPFISQTPPFAYLLSAVSVDLAIAMLGIFYFSIKLRKIIEEGKIW